jgi:hypothetical protein
MEDSLILCEMDNAGEVVVSPLKMNDNSHSTHPYKAAMDELTTSTVACSIIILDHKSCISELQFSPTNYPRIVCAT